MLLPITPSSICCIVRIAGNRSSFSFWFPSSLSGSVLYLLSVLGMAVSFGRHSPNDRKSVLKKTLLIFIKEMKPALAIAYPLEGVKHPWGKYNKKPIQVWMRKTTKPGWADTRAPGLLAFRYRIASSSGARYSWSTTPFRRSIFLWNSHTSIP